MPYFGNGEGLTSTPVMSAGVSSLDDKMAMAERVGRTDPGFLTSVAVGAPLSALDLVDTVASSVGLTERGSINQSALNAIGSPGLSDFYSNYREGIEIGSGLAGIVGSEVIARRLTGSTSRFMEGVSKLPYVRRVATLDAEYANAMNTVRNVDRALATRGAVGVEQYVGKIEPFRTIPGVDIPVTRSSAVFKAKGLGAAKAVRDTAALEAVMAVGLNQNGFLYDDSAAHNMAWMALGLATGGAAEWLHGAYQIRKFANSDEIRRTFAGALDPSSVENARIFSTRDTKVQGPTVGMFQGDVATDKVTSLLMSRSSLADTPITHLTSTEARSLQANRDSLSTQMMKQAQESMQSVAVKGITTDGRTRFSLSTPYYGNHVNMMMYRDPTAFYGARYVGAVPEDSSIYAIHRNFVERTDERIAEVEEQLLDESLDASERAELQRFRLRLGDDKRLTPMASIDGELMPISEATAIEGFAEPTIEFIRKERGIVGQVKGSLKGEDRHGLWATKTGNPAGEVSLDSDFILHLPGGKSLDNADHFDILRLYRTGREALNQMVNFKGPIRLPEKPNWFQLDMAEQLLRENPTANIVYPQGMSRETAMVESIAQKAEAVGKWDISEGLKADNLKTGETYEGNLSKLRVRYNLPKLSGYERGVLGEIEHPVEKLLRGVYAYGPGKIRTMSVQELKEAAAQFKRLGDFAPSSGRDFDTLAGNSFNYMRDDSGKAIKPLVVYKRPFQPQEWTQEMVAERMAAGKMHTVETLIRSENAPMSRTLTAEVINNPDFELASRSHELMDTQIQGSIIGSPPQTMRGSLANAIRTSEQRDRDNPILLAATRVREAVTRQARDFMKVSIEQAFGDTLSLLKNPRNAGSKYLLDQFHSFRSGWELRKAPVSRDGGFHAFVLRDTPGNRERFREVFGREMQKNQPLLNPDGKEVVLDDLSLAAQGSFNQVTELIRQEKNALLSANGRSAIESMEWYTPPPNTNGKYMGFVLGPDNKPVPGLSIVEDTADAFAKARESLTPRLEQLGMGYVFRTQDEIKDFAGIWERVQMDFIDPGTTAIQPGKRNKGLLGGANLRVNAFEDSLKYLQDSYLSHADDLIETLFKEQINSAKARSNIASEVTRNNASVTREQKYRNVYDIWLENLQGTSKLQSMKSPVGQLYNRIEGSIDKFLAEGTPTAARVWTALNGWVGRVPGSNSVAAKKDFEALSTQLGKYMPFKDTSDYLERMGAGATPPTVAKMTAGLNKFSAAMTLRIMEVAHPVMNLAGMVNSMPAVIRSLAQRPGEDTAAYAARVGHNAMIFNLQDGSSVGVLDMPRLGARAFKRAWSKESEADYQYMVRNGFLSQEVAEFQRQFGAIDGPGKWKTFFEGNPHSNNTFAKKGLVGWLSVLSDKSEDFSRSWGHMVGLEVADTLGIVNREARHAFAHDVANKMIANYSPQNRPEVFQGALGAPFGLFQSFVIGYYQRLMRYVETKNWQALGQQYAMQASLFGVTGVPGWQQATALLTDESGTTPEEGIYARLPASLASVIGHGTIANIPKIFGGEGVDVYSRGDVNPRIPGLSTSGSWLDSVPGFAVANKMVGGIAEGISAAASGQWSGTRLAEIASNTIANRPIAGMIEQFFANGDDTDRYGQLVNETKSASEAAYRLIGLRSERQSMALNAFYANKNAQEQEASRMEMLRLNTRTSLRDGTFEQQGGQIFKDYLDSGGDPRRFRRWVKDQYDAATQSRAERQLEKAMNPTNPNMEYALRLMDAGVSIGDEDDAPDPSQDYGSAPDDPLNQNSVSLGEYPNQMTTQ